MVHHWHPIHHHRLTHELEMRKLYWSHFARCLSAGLVSIFTPIFLLQNGASFYELIYFYMIICAVNMLFAPIAFRLMTTIGSNVSMFLSGGFQGAVYILLATYSGSSPILWLIAVLIAAANELYWPAFHASFSLAEDHDKSGEQVGKLTILSSFAQAVSPLAGGVLAYYFGIEVLYFPAAIMLILGALPLLTHRNRHKEIHFSLRKLSKKVLKTDMVAVLGSSSIGLVEQLAWPVAIFLILDNLALIGGLSTVMLLMSMFIAIYVGKRIRLKGTKHFINLASRLIAVLNVLRVFASGILGISGANLLGGAVNSLNGTAYTTAFYRNANEEKRLSYLFAAELTWQIGWLVVLSIMLIVAHLTDSSRTPLVAALVIAALGSNLVRRMR